MQQDRVQQRNVGSSSTRSATSWLDTPQGHSKPKKVRRSPRSRARSWCRARAHPHRQPMGRVPGSMATMSGCCWTRHRVALEEAGHATLPVALAVRALSRAYAGLAARVKGLASLGHLLGAPAGTPGQVKCTGVLWVLPFLGVSAPAQCLARQRLSADASTVASGSIAHTSFGLLHCARTWGLDYISTTPSYLAVCCQFTEAFG